MIEPLLGPEGVRRLRDALLAAGFTSDGVPARLDQRSAAALRSGDLALARHSLTGDDPLATLIRLFSCGGTEPAGRVEAAVHPVPLADLVAAGMLVASGDEVRAGVDLQPYADGTAPDSSEPWWVVADLPAALRSGAVAADGSRASEPLPVDHVLGIGGASTTLALATMRRPVGRALDIGTGCGVQALHLARHSGQVTATDVSDRALRFAATTAALSGQEWELLAGDLAAPVAGRRFDLVVSNPPFIMGPGDRPQVTYRDSGRAGDAVCAELIRAMPDLLTDGGHAQFLANWAHPTDGNWAERLAGFLAGTGLDAWIIQREVSDPGEYVRMWLSDVGDGDVARASSWLDWFEAQRIEAVGFGIVNLRAGGHDDPTVRIEDLRQQPERPFGALVPEWFDRQDWLRARPGSALLAARLRAAESLSLHQESRRGPDGWSERDRRFVLAEGARWVEDTDELVAALVAGSSGSVTVRDQLSLLAAAHGLDEAALAEAAVPAVTGLVERGILLPA
ncbi:MAG: methyltransferase [Actinocatenispora sp.]